MGNNYCDKVRTLIADGYKPDLVLASHPDVIGVHSTSVEAVLKAAERGRLLGYDSKHQKERGNGTSFKGHLFFSPIKERFRGTQFYDGLEDIGLDYFFEIQNMYARTKAFAHYLVAQLGFMPQTPSMPDLSLYSPGHTDKVIRREIAVLIYECDKQGISKDNVMKALNEVRERKGVHIGISQKVLELDVSRDESDEENNSMRVRCSSLPLEYIVGIIPISEPDRNALTDGLELATPRRKARSKVA